MQDEVSKQKEELKTSAKETLVDWVQAKATAMPTSQLALALAVLTGVSWLQDLIPFIDSLLGPYDEAIIGFPAAMITLELLRRAKAAFDARRINGSASSGK